MSPQFRFAIIKVHAAIAAFCLPIGIMFLLTGALQTAGFKGETTKEVFDIHLSNPIMFSRDNLLQLAKNELDERGIEHPTGKIRYREKSGRKELKWSGLNKRLRLASTVNPRILKLTIKTPSWFRRFMQLHKANGKEPFKVYAMVWAALLFTLLMSGVAMAWQVKKLRVLAITSTLLGIVTFLSLLFHSIWYA